MCTFKILYYLKYDLIFGPNFTTKSQTNEDHKFFTNVELKRQVFYHSGPSKH